jgi:hypothetical protein
MVYQKASLEIERGFDSVVCGQLCSQSPLLLPTVTPIVTHRAADARPRQSRAVWLVRSNRCLATQPSNARTALILVFGLIVASTVVSPIETVIQRLT